MGITAGKLHQYLKFKLPAAWLCGVKLKELDRTEALVQVRFRWINQNPFRSMYFAVQSMAAELSTGALMIKKIKECNKDISFLVVNHQGSFSKKAIGLISFKCTDGEKIDTVLEKAIETGEGQIIRLSSIGTDENGEQVSSYEFEWSIKLRTTT